MYIYVHVICIYIYIYVLYTYTCTQSSSSQIHHRSRCTNTTCPFLSVRDIVWCNAGVRDAVRGPWRRIRIPSCATANQPEATWINKRIPGKTQWSLEHVSIFSKIQNHCRDCIIVIYLILKGLIDSKSLHAWEDSTIFCSVHCTIDVWWVQISMMKWRERSLFL